MPGYLMDTIQEDEVNEIRVYQLDFETGSSEDEAMFHGFQTPTSEVNHTFT